MKLANYALLCLAVCNFEAVWHMLIIRIAKMYMIMEDRKLF